MLRPLFFHRHIHTTAITRMTRKMSKATPPTALAAIMTTVRGVDSVENVGWAVEWEGGRVKVEGWEDEIIT